MEYQKLLKRPKVFDSTTVDWILSEATRMAKEGRTRIEITHELAHELDTSPSYIDNILSHRGWKIKDVKPKKKEEKEENSEKKRNRIDPVRVIELAKKYADAGIEKKEAMKRIADELGVVPKSLYKYFKKYNLHALFSKPKKSSKKTEKQQEEKETINVEKEENQVIKIPANRRVKIIIVVE